MALIEDDAGNIYDDGTDYSNEGRSYSTDQGRYQIDTQGAGGSPVNSSMTNLSGLTGILGSFKGIFDRLKSGSTTTNDVSAALGVLGLLMPSLTAPKTAGWKGSIDLNKQFTRTPMVNPATSYVPYSGKPVMGQQYFTSTYGAPAAPPPAAGGGSGGAADPQQQPNYTESSGMAQGGIAMLARGGSTGEPRYLRGQTDGMADELDTSIDGVQPAKLSHGEFVVPADVVADLGNGNNEAGAEVLYDMMDRVRMARHGTKKQGKQIDPEKFTPGGIAGYAGGGAVAFNTGGTAVGGTGATTAPLGSSTEQNIAEWAGPYVGDMLSKTSALTNAPYQAWTGPLSAGYSPLQQKTFTGLESLSFPGQLGQSFTGTGAPTLPTASTTGPMQTVGGTGIAANYMNPYLNAVLQPQLEELRRQSQISEMGNAAKFAQAGGYGGGREAIMRAEGQRNLLGEMNKAIGTGYASAYDKAMGQFNTEQGQAKTLAEMMAGAGQQQRGIEQEGITEARKQFETEQLKPYTDLRFQKEMLSGLPVQTAATTANTSTLGQFSGGFEQLAKALKELGVG
jgi:hypothetical protein